MLAEETLKRPLGSEESELTRTVRARVDLSGTRDVPNNTKGAFNTKMSVDECEESNFNNETVYGRPLHKIIAEGAFGSVCCVTAGEAGGTLASKEIQLALVSSHGVTADRLSTECSILRELVHPNVTRYYNTSTTRGDRVFCMTMDFIAGNTLASLIACDVGPAETDIVEWTRQIASALSYCQCEGVVHGDLRAENIFLTGTSTPAIVKIVGFDPHCLIAAKTNAFGVKQSVYYSPERISGLPYDDRDDMWALGCILLELVTNAR
jgi:serine/threonine protein kinase